MITTTTTNYFSKTPTCQTKNSQFWKRKIFFIFIDYKKLNSILKLIKNLKRKNTVNLMENTICKTKIGLCCLVKYVKPLKIQKHLKRLVLDQILLNKIQFSLHLLKRKKVLPLISMTFFKKFTIKLVRLFFKKLIQMQK